MSESPTNDRTSEKKYPEAKNVRDVATQQESHDEPAKQQQVRKSKGQAEKPGGLSDATTAFAREALKAMSKGAVKIREGTKSALKDADRLIKKGGKASFRRPEWASVPFRRHRKFTPPADFAIMTDAYEIVVQLPGLEEKDVSVKLSGEQVTISGQRPEGEAQKPNQSYLVQELRYGEFERSFRIPRDADRGKIEARVAKGVLTVRIPKYRETLISDQEVKVRSS